MSAKVGCYSCHALDTDSMASVYCGEPHQLVAQLCEGCFANSDARAALATAFVAGELGEDARLVWFREVPGEGVRVLRVERSKAAGRAIAAFIGNVPLSVTRG